MLTGEFFKQYFNNLHIKPNGEANVLCPFPHAKGYEKNPSAHINLEKGVFHCKTCQAEGRFNNGGLSEIDFISHIYNISYEQAAKFMSDMDEKSLDNETVWERAVENLQKNTEAIEYLKRRGITEETIQEYQLGFVGDGIVYPVFIHGMMLDQRTYNPNPSEGEPKIKSLSGASPLLFPFDHWYRDRLEKPTLLCAGENDTLLARQLGFNAVTTTMGEGNFPQIFAGLFKGIDVFICYDCDDAGKNASKKVAFILQEAGANVRLVDLGLPGTKEDKDLTDFIVKHKKTGADILQHMQNARVYTEEEFKEAKNLIYPLVDLWEVADGRFSGKRLSSRVIMLGKYDVAMETPSSIEYKCNGPVEDNLTCVRCPFRNKSGWWTLGEDNLNDVLELVEVTPNQKKNKIASMIGIPEKCPSHTKTVRTRQRVQKVILAPDVETEADADYRHIEQYAYVVGDRMHMEDGQRYRVYFKRYAHPLQDQRVFLVIDKIEQSDNAINSFKMTPEIRQQLSVFQGDPFIKMEERTKRAKDIVGVYVQDHVIQAIDLIYHSPLQMEFREGKIEHAFPEILIVGESRAGKTDPAKSLMNYYGLGNYTACKTASTAGLLGGADKLPNGGHRIKWGEIPRNHRGLLILDELSGMPQEVLASLTDLRSDKVAKVAKIVAGKAPALTRLLWISNPRTENNRSVNIQDVSSGVDLIIKLVGSDEDIARFDLILLVIKGADVSPLAKAELPAYDPQVYRNLIYWIWSRTVDQIKWGENVREYIVQVAKELNEKYDCDIKFFGPEAYKKLARLSLGVAGATFSCSEDGECIVVQKKHVDWAARFMASCYDNDIFNLSRYVNNQRAYNETNDKVNAIVANLAKTHPFLIKTLLESNEPIPRFNLQAVSGLANDDFNEVTRNMAQNFLITVTKEGFRATRRLRKAIAQYLTDREEGKHGMIPLTQQGGSII